MRFVLVLLAALARAQGPEPGRLQDITVKPGDTLWSIAQTYLKDPKRWNEILAYNKTLGGDPTVALPGMTLRVPIELVKERYRSATLVRVEKEVLHRKRETADWNSAHLSQALYPEDGLRTLAQASAQVRFSAGELLSLGPDSMVILSPPKKDSDLKLMRGQVRTGKARVLTASALVLPASPDAEYTARVKDDLTTLVQVHSGRASVQAQGTKVELKAGYGLEVPMGQAPAPPVLLSELPGLDEGLSAGARIPHAVLENGVLSLKTPPPPAKSPDALAGREQPVTLGSPISAYHVQIAADPSFANPAYDKVFNAMDRIDLNRLKLPPVPLYWRVALIDLLGAAGRWSEPRPFARPDRKN